MRRARGTGGRFLNTKKADGTAADAESDYKIAASYGTAATTPTDDPMVNSQRANPASSKSSSDHHESAKPREMPQAKAFSSVNGGSYYARHREFQVPSYRSLSGDRRRMDKEGDFSGQHRDRIMVNGTHRALTIK